MAMKAVSLSSIVGGLRAHGCQYSDDSVAYLSSGTRIPGCQDNEDATVVMNVESLSFRIRVPGCHVKDDSVGNEADSGNAGCLP